MRTLFLVILLSAVSIPRFFLLASVLLALPLFGSVDDTWKDLYSQAQRASAIKDYAKSEEIYKKALHEAERFGDNDVRVASTSEGLGVALRYEKKFTEAEAAAQRAVTIYFATTGTDSLEYADAQFDFADILIAEGKLDQALQSLGRLLPVFDRNFGPSDVKTAAALCMQGDAFRTLKRYASAEIPLKRCADIREEDAGVVTPEFGEAANSLAIVYQHLGKYSLADSYFKYPEIILERSPEGILNPQLADALEAHAAVLRQLGREEEAKKKEKLASAIRAHTGRK